MKPTLSKLAFRFCQLYPPMNHKVYFTVNPAAIMTCKEARDHFIPVTCLVGGLINIS